MNQALQILLLGASLGGVYALMASGLTLIFGVMRIVNIAHAVLMIAAAYIAYYAFQLFSFDPILSIFITMPVIDCPSVCCLSLTSAYALLVSTTSSPPDTYEVANSTSPDSLGTTANETTFSSEGCMVTVVKSES